MAKDLRQLLHHDSIMKVVESVKGGVPDGVLDGRFFTATERIEGVTGTYSKVESTRRVAQLVMPGSPSRAKKFKGVTTVPVTLMRAFEHFQYKENTMDKLLSTDEQRQILGVEEAARELKTFLQRFVNLRRAAVYAALGNGKLCFDSDWNLRAEGDEDVVYSIDYGVPASNRDQLGGIISAKWSAAATNLTPQIKALKKLARRTTGYALRTAYYGDNVPGYIAANTTMKEYLKLNSSANDAIKNGEIPNGFLGLDWAPAGDAFFENADGENVEIFGDDQITFAPDIANAGWYGFIEGTNKTPTDIGKIYGDAMAALASLKQIYGMFSYATVTDDPVAIKQFGGDTFLPLISVPKSIFIAKVHW